MTGRSLAELGLSEDPRPPCVAVKEVVFPFDRFPGTDVLLGPEMKSTGEVMGVDSDFGRAYAKSQIEAGNGLPTSGSVLVSMRAAEHQGVVEPIRMLADSGFEVIATRGTAEVLAKNGIEARMVNKVHEGSPHTVDLIDAGEVDLVIGTVDADRKAVADSFAMRRAALQRGIPYCTTLAAARASAAAIIELRRESIGVRSLQDVHARIQSGR